jgi:hypothetical protein
VCACVCVCVIYIPSAAGALNNLTVVFETTADLGSSTHSTSSTQSSLVISGLTAARLPRVSSDATSVGLTEAGASVRLTEYTEAGVARELARSQRQSASAHLLYSSSSILFEPATALFQDGNLTLWLMPGALLSAGVRYSFSVLLRNPMDRTAEAQVCTSY